MRSPTASLMLMASLCALYTGQELAAENTDPRAIEPGASGAVSATLAPDGEVSLENEFLRFVFDPDDAGAASSIQLRGSGKELGVCVTYSGRHFKAFRESLSIQRMKEGRISPSGRPYKLVQLRARDGKAIAAFAGHPYVPHPNAEGRALAMGEVRIVKTYTLRAGASKLDIGIEAVNESEEPLPVALWLLSGLRVHGESVECFAPFVRGTMARPDSWVKGASTFLVVPRPPAPWTAAIGSGPDRTGMCIAVDEGMVDAIHNWLAKFAGYTLGFGTPQLDVEPGKALSFAYSFIVTTGLPRIDGASRHLACGIELPDEAPLVAQPFGVRVSVASPEVADVSLTLKLRKLPDPVSRTLSDTKLHLDPGKAVSTNLEVTAPTEGTYVVTAELVSPNGRALRVERPFIVGLSAERYAAKPPDLRGKPFWSLAAEGPQPSWMRQCDRSVKHPMVPWNVPRAGRKLKVLFIGNPGYTTGIFRDLARRAGVDWDFINLCRTQGAAYGTDDDTDEPYRVTEQRLVQKRLEEDAPDCVLTAGLQYDNVEIAFIDSLLASVEKGLGLVVISRPGPRYSGPWPAVLKKPGFKKLEGDFMGALRTLFEANVAPKPVGQIECYEYGKGRLLIITKEFVFSPQAYSRNDLLPQIRGRTRLPDWEYHFAQFVKALNYAAQASPSARILDAQVSRDAIRLSYTSDRDREASVEYDLVSADLLRGEHAVHTVKLAKGRHNLTLPAKRRPGNEYVLHLWLLEGGAEESRTVTDEVTSLLQREENPRPVLDFAAAHCHVRSLVWVEEVTVDGAWRGVPEAIHVKLKTAKGAKLGPLTAVAEIRNGRDSRVAWRGRKQWNPVEEPQISFEDLRYTPVAPESVAVITVHAGDEVLCSKGHRFHRKVTGDIAEEDMVFTTTTGVQSDWYVTQVMRKWAVDEAGLNATFYDHGLLHIGLFGMGSANFPWRRVENNRLSPPIVDERPLREQIAEVLRKRFEGTGTTYFCLQDEFRLGGEYDWSPEALTAFREHLQRVYRAIDKLNTEWGTAYGAFDEATPLLLKDAQERPENLAPWLDFRLFMDSRVNRRYEVANEEAAQISPLIRVGESGMYPPAYNVGVNYYTVSQACRLMMTYAGLRAEWTRAFLPDDSIAGVWMGYGGQHSRHPWEALFRGYRLLAWWGYLAKGLPHLAMIRPDLVPNRRFVEVGQQQSEIRRGLGKLLVHARLAEPQAFIPYSQASVYTADALDADYVAATSAGVGLLRGEGIPHSFIADEQAVAGRLDQMRDKLFVFPGTRALPLRAAAAYARAIDRGCHALADAEVATRDGHGKRLPAGELEAAFGIRRAKAAHCDETVVEQITWTTDAPEELRTVKGQMAKALGGVTVADGNVWARFPDDSPAVVARPSEADSLAIWLNTRLAPPKRTKPKRPAKAEDRIEALPPSATNRIIARFLSDRAGIGPAVRLTPAEFRPGLASEFVDGRTRYYGLLLGRAKGEATVAFPRKAHSYDVRAGQYLGQGSAFQDTFDPASHAKVYAQLPYQIRGLSATVDSPAKRGGDSVQVEGEIEADGGATEYHVIRCEVIEPNGTRPRYHTSNVPAPRGKFEVHLPIALNAPAGEWKIELRDIASGAEKVLRFTVD